MMTTMISIRHAIIFDANVAVLSDSELNLVPQRSRSILQFLQ